MNVYGVIMAGGGGTRFWPLSRKDRPKQLLNLSGRELMINETIDRISSVIPRKDIFVVTNQVQEEKMRIATKDRIQEDHILIEAAARNTAACIGYGAMEIVKRYKDGIMCVFPSDHFIKNESVFSKVLEDAVRTAEESDMLVTMGITPLNPSTAYGYIKYDRTGGSNELQSEEKRENTAYKVIEFKEKPDYDTAKAYVESGQYAWNSGMFVWKASVILKKFKELLPEIYESLEKIGGVIEDRIEGKIDNRLYQAGINEIYPQIPSISIDYGIMEKSEDVVVIPADFGWSDVGSFDNLGVLYDEDKNGNVVCGDIISIDTKDSILYGKNKLIATIGISDIIAVETDDAVLICKKDRCQDVKKVVDILKETGRDEYL